MCGIAGIIRFSNKHSIGDRLETATRVLQHRGPEAPAYWVNKPHTVGLGHCRLSIIDPDPRSAQPFLYGGRYRLVYNGEIYNYIELRNELTGKGCRFSTTSDTEVLVAAYQVYGRECVQHFEGMFAFAIWDEQEQILFCARDRFGEKPFYYYADEDQLLFASEMKALWRMGIAREVNPAMLYNFLTIEYTTNPGDPSETFFTGIRQLPAASILHLSLPEQQLYTERYWQLYPKVDTTLTAPAALDRFDTLFTASIRRRLRSDVPIGTSLSGGLDSSAIVACCRQMASSQYSHQCFTAVFPGFDRDEAAHAQKVAREYGLQQHLVHTDAAEIPTLMQKVMQQQEVPFSSASVLAQYKVYEAASQAGIKVLLDGQGADETLGGYHKYFRWYWQELYRKKELTKSKELEQARALGIKETFGWPHRLAALVPHFAMTMLQGRKTRQAFHAPDLNREFAQAHKQHLYYSTPLEPDLNGALYFSTFLQGLEELLRLADRNSMAHSVEVRLPYLSHELVSFLFTLPPSFKIREGWTKWLLRKSMVGRLPEAIVWRKDKVGFEPPQQQWMQHPQVNECIMEGRRKLVAGQILQPGVLDKKIKPHGSHAADIRDWKYWSASFLFDDN